MTPLFGLKTEWMFTLMCEGFKLDTVKDCLAKLSVEQVPGGVYQLTLVK